MSDQLPISTGEEIPENTEKLTSLDKQPFFKEGNAWFKRTGDDDQDRKILTNFQLQLLRIVKKYDHENRTWERHFDVNFIYHYKGREIISSTIQLRPEQTGTPAEFSKAIWDVDFRTCYITNAIELKQFITFLYQQQNPKEVRIYDYFGFIRIDHEQYYLAKNVLIKIKQEQVGPSEFIAPDPDGTFKVNDRLHIGLDESLDGIPYFDNLGVAEDGFYKSGFDVANLSDQIYSSTFQDVEHHMQQMISGQQEESLPEGSLALGYIFSHIIFNEIFTAFNHIIFFYLHGPGNTGKNSFGEIIYSAFGLPIGGRNNPTLSALETYFSQYSKIPLWVDEFVPENTPGKKNHIMDQNWNSYFQLTPRMVSSRNSRYKTAAPKPVRSSVLFCSNYLPKSDHFSSRLLKIEYNREKRGKEEHYRALQGLRSEIQSLFFSAMSRSWEMKSSYIQKELFYLKKVMSDEVKKRLAKMNTDEKVTYTLHDRQLEQFISLWLSYYLFKDRFYYTQLSNYHEEESPELKESLRSVLDKSIGSAFWEYCANAIVKHSLEEAQKDAFTEFLDVIADLVNSPSSPNWIIQERHFHWTGEDLLIYWSPVWNRYVKQVGAQEAVQVKSYIYKCMDALDEKKCRHNVNWSNAEAGEIVRGKGYRIMAAAQDPRFALAFKYHNSNTPF